MSQLTMLHFGNSPGGVSPPWTVVPRVNALSKLHPSDYGKATLSQEGLRGAVEFELEPQIQDLFDIMVAAYTADLWTVRKASDGWTRGLTINVPVKQPDLWSRTDIASPLTQLLNFVTSDDWNLEFRSGEGLSWQKAISGLTHEPVSEVALFSAGLDSGCFAAATRDNCERSILLSHHNSGHLTNRQSELREALAPTQRHASFSVKVNRRARKVANEDTQRTRGLLFMAAGVLVCAGNGVRRLVVPENGQLAVNPPLTASRPGASMTKSVHPMTVYLMNQILERIDVPQRVENPYALRTKGEVCREVVESGSATLTQLARTVTCSRPEDHAGNHYGNCGYCYACLVRHASLRSAGGDLTSYRVSDPANPNPDKLKPEDRIALLDWLSRDFTVHDLIAAAPLPPDADLHALTDMIVRGRAEIADAFR